MGIPYNLFIPYVSVYMLELGLPIGKLNNSFCKPVFQCFFFLLADILPTGLKKANIINI